MEYILSNPIFLSLAIFLARVADVSLGTVRTITVVRGYRLTSAIIGFFEVLIWILAAGQVLKNLNLNQWYLIASYCAGFAAGNMVGIWLESKLALGNVMVRAISEERNGSLADALRKEEYVVTELQGTGDQGKPVEVILVAEARKHLNDLLTTVKSLDPKAFLTIEDVRGMHQAKLLPRKKATPFSGWAGILKKK